MTQGIQEQEIDEALLMQYPNIVTALKQASKLKASVCELLAVIHGDTGYHTMDVGITQSIKDAITKLSRKDIHSDMYGSNSATSRSPDLKDYQWVKGEIS